MGLWGPYLRNILSAAMLLTGIGNHAAAQSNDESADAFLHMVEVCSTIKDSSQYWRAEAEKAGWHFLPENLYKNAAEILSLRTQLGSLAIPPEEAGDSSGIDRGRFQTEIKESLRQIKLSQMTEFRGMELQPQFYIYKNDLSLLAIISPSFSDKYPERMGKCELIHISQPDAINFSLGSIPVKGSIDRVEVPKGHPLILVEGAIGALEEQDLSEQGSDQTSPKELILLARFTPLNHEMIEDQLGRSGAITNWRLIWRFPAKPKPSTQPSEKVTP